MITKITPKIRLKISRAQIAQIIFRTMRIEESKMTKAIAKKAARGVKLPRK